MSRSHSSSITVCLDIISRIEKVDVYDSVAAHKNYLIPAGQTEYQGNELEGN